MQTAIYVIAIVVAAIVVSSAISSAADAVVGALHEVADAIDHHREAQR